MEFTWADLGSGVKEPDGKLMNPPDRLSPPNTVMGRRQFSLEAEGGLGAVDGAAEGWIERAAEAVPSNGAVPQAQNRTITARLAHLMRMQRGPSGRRY